MHADHPHLVSFPSRFASKTYESRGLEGFSSLEPTADGGYMVAGWMESYPPSSLVVRIDASGNVIWAKTLTGMIGGRVWPAAGDGYIVTGADFDPVFNDPYSWIAMKIDDGGRVIWQKTYIGNKSVDAIRKTADGGCVAAGRTYDRQVTAPRAFAMKLDASGGIVWQKTYPDASMNGVGLGDIQQSADGGYLLVSNREYLNYPRYGARLLKLDPGGNIVWQRSYESDGAIVNFVDGFLSSADGGYVMAFSPDPAQVVKVDARGSIVWQMSYGREGHHPYLFEASGDNGLLIGGLSLAGTPWLLKNDADGAGAGCAIEGSQQLTAVDSQATAADGIFKLTSSGLTHASPTVVVTDIAAVAQEMCPVPSR